MRKALLALFILCSNWWAASGEMWAAGARSVALGECAVTLSDVFSASNNPAGLGFIHEYSVGFYGDRKFVLADVNNFSGAIALPFDKIGCFAVDGSFYGNKNYSESKAGISYARAFGEKFSLGVKFHFIRLFIAENGSRNFYTAQLGFQYKPWKPLTLAAHLYNPIPYKAEKYYGEKLPTIIQAGIAYTPIKQLLLSIEYEQNIYAKPGFKAGIEYTPIKYLSLRTGFKSNAFQFSFGLGLHLPYVSIDLASQYHPQMGFSPAASLLFSFAKKKKE